MSGAGAPTEPSSEGTTSQVPWTAIPRFIPGTTDVSEYSKKLQFLADVWPKEHLPQLAPRAALLCEGTAFKKLTRIAADKLKTSDTSGVQLLITTLGGSWGRTGIEEKYDFFEKAIYSTVQKGDETNDSYLARHDVQFEELLSQGTTLDEVRAYVLLRQSQLSAEDRKKIVVEHGGDLNYKKVCASIRLLGSKFFADLQGQRGPARNKVYDANFVEDNPPDEGEKAFTASSSAGGGMEDADPDLDPEFIEAMVASEDADALMVQSFEDELEGFFQETPELQEALVSYMEARGRLLAKRKSRGFWPVSSQGKGTKGGRFKGKGGGKGKGSKEQLLARIARSTCRACGEKGHWKAECPKFGRPGSMGGTRAEAPATVAQVDHADAHPEGDEILHELPLGAQPLTEEAHVAFAETVGCRIKGV